MQMKPDEFWRLTYAEFVIMWRGYVRRHKQKINEILYLAWHTAALSRQQKLPELKEIMLDEEEKPARHVMTDEQMEMMARALNTVLGGDFVEQT